MNAIAELAAGQEIGKYRIARELGRGGMGVVYLATDTTLGREVALKLLHPALSITPDFAHRFKQEARAIAALSHPNIVDIHALEIIDGRLLIDVRYLEGGSLTDRFAAQVVTVPQLARWSSEILSALSQCHDAGVIHRDVKPANILFDSHSRALLSDFGLAKAYSSHVGSVISRADSSGFFLGSPRYAPPEAWSDGEPTPCWDIYSLGIVIYEAIAGSPPYSGMTPLAILNQIMSRTIPPLSSVCGEVSPTFGQLVDDMVHRDPKKRPQDGAEALERLIETPEYEQSRRKGEHTVVVRKPARTSPIPSAPPPKRPLFRYLGAALAVSAVALVLPFVTRGNKLAEEPNGGLAGAEAATPASATNTLGATKMPTLEDLVSRKKSPDSPLFSVYEVALPGESQAAESWYVADSHDTGPTLVYGIGPSTLSSLELAPTGETTFRLTGNWAEYLDSGASVIRYGTLEGHGRWLTARDVFTAALHCTSENDGAVQDRVISGSLSASGRTDAQLALEIEGHPKLLPLLCNELVTRNFAWATSVENLLPALGGSRADAPVVSVAQGQQVFDERIFDEFWNASLNRTDNAVQGWPPEKSPTLRVCCNQHGLFIGMNSASASPENTTVELAVLCEYYIPVRDSPVWLLRWTPDDKVSVTLIVGDKATPLNDPWSAKGTPSASAVSVSIFIPFSSFGTRHPSNSGDRWRVNARVLGRDSGSDAVPEAFWGNPNFADVTHGAVIVLGAGLPVQQEQG